MSGRHVITGFCNDYKVMSEFLHTQRNGLRVRYGRRIQWIAFAIMNAIAACTPSRIEVPEVDSGDGGRLTCAAECAARAAHGCLESRFAARCVSVCELSRAGGTYEPCSRCEHYAGSDGAEHVRCVR
jgi:hypothetical protein